MKEYTTSRHYFYNSLPHSPPPPPKIVPILYFLLFLPYMHVFIVFFCHCNRATARCSQDGIIGENVCAAYFSQGLSLANYCLDGSQRFSPITCIFPVSRVDAGQGSARTVSVVLSLAMVLPMSREVAHSSPYYKSWQVKGLKYMEGDTTCPTSFLSTQKKSELLALLTFLKSQLYV